MTATSPAASPTTSLTARPVSPAALSLAPPSQPASPSRPAARSHLSTGYPHPASQPARLSGSELIHKLSTGVGKSYPQGYPAVSRRLSTSYPQVTRHPPMRIILIIVFLGIAPTILIFFWAKPARKNLQFFFLGGGGKNLHIFFGRVKIYYLSVM